ncbi:MAG: carboxypeptidase regulatory-like domain-containing protein [Acidobacteria bacterium]|nr:carboxypeptidase regulatory-like domain-containing protein [Acidobacteriota bacterium]
MREQRLFWSTCVAVLLWGAISAAQVTTGTISGRVQDFSASVVPGVAITVRHVETGLTRAAVSDEPGRYRVIPLPLGSYLV